MSLFGTKSKASAHERFPDEYYKSVYLSKKMFDGVELVAKIEGKSKKKTVELLLEEGFSSYMGTKLKEHIKNEQKIKELNLRRHPYPTRFVKVVRKFCKEHGIDFSKII